MSKPKTDETPLSQEEFEQLTKLKRKVGGSAFLDHMVTSRQADNLSDEGVLAEIKVHIWGKMKVGSYEMALIEQLINRFTNLRWKGEQP